MESNGGLCYFDEFKDDLQYIHRYGAATFTKQEQENLEKYGDFIAIDPTFYTLSSHWSIIPLTVIGIDREIRSAGLCFCSNTRYERFLYILNLLTTVLPSKEIFQTLCSDDDSGLKGAFSAIRNDKKENYKPDFKNKVLALNRVICFWHKISNFIAKLSKLNIPENQIITIRKLFKKMGMSRDETVTKKIYEELENCEQLKSYMQENIKEDLQYIAKSMIKGFNCGYNTSSIAESTNSKLKAILPDRSLSLKDIRTMYNNSQRLSILSKEYICGRKQRKVKDSLLIDIMQKFNLSENVSSSICNSIMNSETLKLVFIDEDKTTAEVQECDPDFEAKYQEKFIVTQTQCSCKKQMHTGLPCKHIIKFLQEKNLNVLDHIIVSPRWNSTDIVSDFQIEQVNPIQINRDTTSPVSRFERYNILKNLCEQLMNIGSQSHEMFTLLRDKLNQLYESSLCKPVIIDVVSRQPGRPPISKNLANRNSRETCKICGKNHSTMKCPRRDELLSFEPTNADKTGRSHCSICGLSQHTYKQCWVKNAWLKAISDNLLPPLD